MLQRMIEDAKKNPVKSAPIKKDSPATKKTNSTVIKKEGSKAIIKKDSGLKSIRSDTPARNTVAAPNSKNDILPPRNVIVSLPDSTLIDSQAAIIPATSLPDTLQVITAVSKPINWQQDTAFRSLLNIHIPGLSPKILLKQGDYRISNQKDFLFYLLMGLVLLLAITKQLFPRYLNNIFTMMFQANYRQKQTREILMQNRFPSLLLNILFILVASTFLSLTILSGRVFANLAINLSFWNLEVYCITFFGTIYLVKYITLVCLGWAFKASDETKIYSFIVFVINKLIGLFLLPLLFLIGFSTGKLLNLSLTISVAVVVIMLFLRFGLSFLALRKKLNISPFHFFIYLCGIEIMPLLLLYKAMIIYLGESNL